MSEYPKAWFEVTDWCQAPIRQTFDRETTHMLYRKDSSGGERGVKKWTDYRKWFATKEEALEALEEREKQRLEKVLMQRASWHATEIKGALEYARNLIGPDEILDAALNKLRGVETNP